MSLVSVYTNRDIVKKYLDDINVISAICPPISVNDEKSYLSGYVISDCAVKHYEMKRNYLNINMINKRYLTDNISGYELLDTMYQHIYMHNHVGMEDELYEVLDAYEKYEKLPLNSDDEKIMMVKLLILEEWIDAYHFITELTGTLKEHFLMTLQPDKIKSTRDLLEYYFTEENDFSDDVKYLILAEGWHIAEEMNSKTPMIFPQFIQTSLYMDTGFVNCGKQTLRTLQRLNREFIRETNFKDWKQYPNNYFDPVKFAKLSNINRDMYYYCLQGISYNLVALSELLGKKLNENNSDDVYKLLYAVYNQKRKLNIDRQLNDPRYKLNNNGNIVGDKI